MDISSTSHKIQEGLWINVYPTQDNWYLTLLLPSGKVIPVSPVEAGYKDIPAINTMEKLNGLARRVRSNDVKSN